MKNNVHGFMAASIAVFLYISAFPIARAEENTASAEKNNLAVMGVFNELKSDTWKDYRIGFGVGALIAQSLYNTGEFTPLEEKKEIKDKLAEFSTGIWEAASAKKYDLTEDEKEVQLLGADCIAYGRLFYFGKPQSQFSMGFVHRNVQEAIIKIEITIINLDANKKISAEGTGKSQLTANSILFQFRDDNSLNFDETDVGKATKNAIEEAVGKLVKDIKKIKNK